MAKGKENLFKGKETFGEELKEAKAIKSGKISPREYAMGEKSEGKKFMPGGSVRGVIGLGRSPGAGYAKGGFVSAADGVAKSGRTKATQIKMKSGGRC